MSRIGSLIVGGGLFCTFLLLVFLLIGSNYGIDEPRATARANIRVLLAAFLFSWLPLAYTVSELESHPQLQPYALATLQAHGRERIKFLSFADEPVYDSRNSELKGLRLKGVLLVTESGQYTVHPMRLEGLYPVSIRKWQGGPAADIETLRIEANSPYTVTYFAETLSLSLSQQPTFEVLLEGASEFSWKVTWRIDSYPPFPFFLLGIGATARVYPDASGEQSFVTHINEKFQTAILPRKVFPIR